MGRNKGARAYVLVIAVSALATNCGGGTQTLRARAGVTTPKPPQSTYRTHWNLPWPDLAEPLPAGGGEKDAAVIVAIEHYDHLWQVPGASRNADDWYAFFARTLAIPVGRVKLLPSQHATREEMLAVLQRAGQSAEPGGRVWFVFIGHGAPAEGDGLLVGVDARQTVNSLENRSLRRSEVLEVLGGSPARPILVLDACFSGQTRAGKPMVPDLQGLELVLSSPGRAVVMTAAASNQYAGPLPGAQRPAFSYLTLGALRGWGDRNGDGSVSAAEATAYAGSVMEALVNGRQQTPEIDGEALHEPLLRSAESGPRIDEFAMKLNDDDLVINRDGLTIGAAPTVNLPEVERGVAARGEVDLGRIDLERERRLEELYLRIEAVKRAAETATSDPTGERQQQAWCELAELEDPNPYREVADKHCAELTSWVEQRRQVVAAMNRDWKTVQAFMLLQHRPLGDKRKVNAAFIGTYGTLTEQQSLRAAFRMRSVLESARTNEEFLQSVRTGPGTEDGPLPGVDRSSPSSVTAMTPHVARLRVSVDGGDGNVWVLNTQKGDQLCVLPCARVLDVDRHYFVRRLDQDSDKGLRLSLSSVHAGQAVEAMVRLERGDETMAFGTMLLSSIAVGAGIYFATKGDDRSCGFGPTTGADNQTSYAFEFDGPCSQQVPPPGYTAAQGKDLGADSETNQTTGLITLAVGGVALAASIFWFAWSRGSDSLVVRTSGPNTDGAARLSFGPGFVRGTF